MNDRLFKDKRSFLISELYNRMEWQYLNKRWLVHFLASESWRKKQKPKLLI